MQEKGAMHRMANRTGRAAAGAGSVRKRPDGRWEGHYSSAFPMDVYAAVGEEMKKETQDKTEALIQRVSDL